jgi:hypothetical protein
LNAINVDDAHIANGEHDMSGNMQQDRETLQAMAFEAINKGLQGTRSVSKTLAIGSVECTVRSVYKYSVGGLVNQVSYKLGGKRISITDLTCRLRDTL